VRSATLTTCIWEWSGWPPQAAGVLAESLDGRVGNGAGLPTDALQDGRRMARNCPGIRFRPVTIDALQGQVQPRG
jgi:hypothetical protein